MKKSAVQRAAKCEREGLCCSCLEPLGDEKPIRGCHPRCAHATYRAIKSGLLTDAGQVAAGEWLPASSGGRPPSLAVSKKARAS
jgi:hypothetical protein